MGGKCATRYAAPLVMQVRYRSTEYMCTYVVLMIGTSRQFS
jgi:hypothetical protein